MVLSKRVDQKFVEKINAWEWTMDRNMLEQWIGIVHKEVWHSIVQFVVNLMYENLFKAWTVTYPW